MPQYSQPVVAMPGEDSIILMDYYFPIFFQQEYLGGILVSYKLSALLEEVVPWWFAKDNEVSILDIDDSVVADRADGGLGHNVFVHSKNLDLSGVNLILKTNSTKDSPKLLSNYLVATVIILGVGLSWSLWALWRDVLRRHAAETALRTEMAFRKAMEKSLITGLRVRSMDGRLLYVNSAFCEMMGYAEEELIGQKAPFSFWTLEAFENLKQLRTVGAVPSLNGFETVYQHSGGRKVPVLIYESALLNESGVQIGWMGSILDISERKRTEQILRQNEEKLHKNARLSTMGELASVMAHELNQPLAAINTYAAGTINMIESKKGELKDLQPVLVKMQKQALRAAQIIHSVHDFVAKRSPNRSKIQFNEVFRKVLPLIEMQAKSFLISLKLDIQDPLPDVFIDPIALEEVILNLTRNALQAMQELTFQKRMLQITAKQEKDFVQVEVIDNGVGIAEEVTERLFSPFFSTKAEGIGMGLNICRTIIEFHGGQLLYHPNPVGGTIFSFTVPVSESNIIANS
jgi:two-component system sensor histidine kinase DctS